MFIDACAAQNIDILITSTYRDAEDQDALYAQGRTAPGNIVTDAKGGDSFHQYHVAFDFVPMVNGKCQWTDMNLITQCGIIGETIGLTWAGRWIKMKEELHLQYTSGLTIEDFQNGKTLPTGEA